MKSPERVRAATPRTARLINDRTAFDLLLREGPLTRSQLRARTGLAGPTVSDLVDRLVHAGLVTAVGETGTNRRGPNARLYGIAPDYAYVAGVEVSRDQVRAVVADVTGAVVGSATTGHDPQLAPDAVVHAAVRAAVTDAGRDEGDLRTVVVGTPGLVDPDSGDVSFIASLPTWHANLLPGLRARFGVPVVCENEVNLVGLAEHRAGVARDSTTFCLLWLDTGVGAAVVLDGRVYRGSAGGAGEVSYLQVAHGVDFQALAGGPAVLTLAGEHGIAASEPAQAVREARAAGPDGAAFLAELADRVSRGAVGICAVVDPGVLVLAGAVGRAGGAELAERVAGRLRELTPLPTDVLVASLGDEPVVHGAVLTALDLLYAEIFASA